jgi:ubiquinone/menaquinone biosynthesis C-methylase UbiE
LSLPPKASFEMLPPPDHQDLDIYWDPEFALVLDSWGEGNAWTEIQLLLVNCKGKILDIACGTGRVMEILGRSNDLEVYGCDISELLIQKAIARGIPPSHLKVCDATKTDYDNGCFDYAYSIGSLEHFTENGILGFLSECRRIVKTASFHQLPVSRSGQDEGWLKTDQSFFNNSVDWWLNRFGKFFPNVRVLDSVWQDDLSLGRWFVCTQGEEPDGNRSMTGI